MITRSAWAKVSSATSSPSPSTATSIPTSSTARASRPPSRSSSRSRSRSGIRAASTWTFSSLMAAFCPRSARKAARTRQLRSRAVAVATREYGLFINGESAEPATGETRDLHEPATGAALATVAQGNEQDVDRAVDAARDALDGPWGKTPPNERSRLLHALADAIVANRKELAELEARNVGKAISSVK